MLVSDMKQLINQSTYGADYQNNLESLFTEMAKASGTGRN
jgi:hypothetical protein